jgi:hypothetical protein
LSLRLPCTAEESVERSIQVCAYFILFLCQLNVMLICGAACQLFVLVRKAALDAHHLPEKHLPLQQPQVALALRDSVSIATYADIIACNVVSKNRQGQLLQVRRFLVVDPWRLILIEPDSSHLGMGIVR